MQEVQDEIPESENYETNRLYQDYLAVDFTVLDGAFAFSAGKDSRDVLGELPAGVPVHFHTAEVGGRIDALAMPLVPEPGGKLIRFEKQRSDEGC